MNYNLRFAAWIVLGGAVGPVACFSASESAHRRDGNECSTSSDCSGTRVCNQGVCEDPGPSSGGTGGDTGGATSGGTGGASTGGSGGDSAGDGGSPSGGSGEDPTGGSSPTGGSAGSGATSTGGATPTGGSGGAPPGGSGGSGTISGTPTKFCNKLARGGQDITLTLELNGVTFTALTGACVPNDQCLGVPSGSNVPLLLREGTTTITSGTFPTVPASGELLLFAEVDASSAPTVAGGSGTGICAAGQPVGGTVAKFCNNLRRNGLDVTLTLDVQGATATAPTGSCAPLDGCLPISSGTNVPIALREGATSVVSGTFPSIPSGASMLFVTDVDTAGPTILGGEFSGVCATTAMSELAAGAANGQARSSMSSSLRVDQRLGAAELAEWSSVVERQTMTRAR